MKHRLYVFMPLLLLLASCASVDNRPKPSPLPHFQLQVTFKPQWSVDVGQATAYANLKPTRSNHHLKGDGFIYTVGGDDVFAHCSGDGKTLWMTSLTSSPISAVGVGEHVLVVATEKKGLAILDRKTGQFLKFIHIPNQTIAKPAIKNQTVVIKTLSDTVCAYDVSSTKRRWCHHRKLPAFVLKQTSDPLIVNDSVLVGFSDGTLSAFDLDTGKTHWRTEISEAHGYFDIQRLADISGRFVVRGGTVYVVGYQSQVAAVVLDTGAILWTHALSSYQGVAVDVDQVYVTAADGDVWAFDRETGMVRWHQKHLRYRSLTAPIGLSDALIFADQTHLYALSKKDGRFLGRYKMHDKGVSSDILSDHHQFYVRSDAGKLTAYQL